MVVSACGVIGVRVTLYAVRIVRNQEDEIAIILLRVGEAKIVKDKLSNLRVVYTDLVVVSFAYRVHQKASNRNTTE